MQESKRRKETAHRPLAEIFPYSTQRFAPFAYQSSSYLLPCRVKKLLLLPLLALAAGCHSEVEAPRATGRDELALATGHWEWDRTVIGFGPVRSPATLGYTRQLVVEPGGQVVIGHNGKVVKTTTYQLSMGTLAGCGPGQQNTPIITFEPDAGSGSSTRKAYSVDTHNGPLRLDFTGDYACVDGGAYEEYHWVAE